VLLELEGFDFLQNGQLKNSKKTAILKGFLKANSSRGNSIKTRIETPLNKSQSDAEG